MRRFAFHRLEFELVAKAGEIVPLREAGHPEQAAWSGPRRDAFAGDAATPNISRP